MKGFFKVFAEECKKIFYDAGVVLILCFAPVLYSLLYPFPYENQIVDKIPVAVVDEDKSGLSRQITSMLNTTEFIDATTEYTSINQAKNAFYERKVYGIIYIPNNFYKNVVQGLQPIVTLFSDGSYMLFYSETFSSAMKVVLTAAAGVKVQRMTMSGVPQEAAIKMQSAVSVVDRPLYNVFGGYGNFVVPGVLALIIQQLILASVFLVHGRDCEKNAGFCSGTGVMQNLLGKGLVYLIFFFVISFYFFQVSISFFHIPDFSKGGELFLFLVPYGLSIVFLGIATAYFATEREGGLFFVLTTSVPLLFLTGFSWPVWEMPLWLQWLRTVFPSSSGVMGLIMMRQMGASLADVSFEYINLWVLTFAYMILAVFSVKAQMKRIAVLKNKS
ncbi:MAG: ABC transporter permease [Deferribacterales bacterium]|nr:ABC transporter permease [Deferribacterales bacterium]